MSHLCYEGNCVTGSKPREFSSIRGFRQHQYKCHQDTPEEETSLGNSRLLKRKRDAWDEEERQNQNIQAQLALEAANRQPEPRPVKSMNCARGTETYLTSLDSTIGTCCRPQSSTFGEKEAAACAVP